MSSNAKGGCPLAAGHDCGAQPDRPDNECAPGRRSVWTGDLPPGEQRWRSVKSPALDADPGAPACGRPRKEGMTGTLQRGQAYVAIHGAEHCCVHPGTDRRPVPPLNEHEGYPSLSSLGWEVRDRRAVPVPRTGADRPLVAPAASSQERRGDVEPRAATGQIFAAQASPGCSGWSGSGRRPGPVPSSGRPAAVRRP